MKKFDLEDVRFRTSIQKSRVIDYENITRKLLNDPEREQRLKSQNCVCCYYISVMAGQGFTSSKCNNCNVEMMFSTTSTDRLCESCAKEFKVCKHCGADLNLKQRNKL